MRGRFTRSTVTITVCRSPSRSEEHTSELQSQSNLVCRLLLEKKKKFLISLPASLTISQPSLQVYRKDHNLPPILIAFIDSDYLLAGVTLVSFDNELLLPINDL